ncbi:MAG: MGMT family protein [Bacteroidota bacterium]
MSEHSNPKNDFFQNVYEVVKLIPHGRVSTYGAIATYLGAKRSARMVGYALNGSFSMHEVPAHRVVNRLGILSGRHHFPADRPMEEALEAEGVTVKEYKVQDFDKVFWDPSIELAL